MADVEQLLREFQRDFEAGGTLRPSDVLARVEGADRRELEALIDAHLTRAPRRSFDAAAFAASPARVLVDDLAEALQGEAGTWKAVLPRLRDAAQLRRAELVRRLAAGLGVSGREQKVARYYHEMEQGLLEPAGVSDRVLVVLAGLVGTTAERLREAGSALRAADESPPDATFARAVVHAEEYAEMMETASAPAEPMEGPDEVDRLFTGGPSA
jgi:hypothetical protein